MICYTEAKARVFLMYISLGVDFMALKKNLMIGVVAALLVACAGTRNSETRSDGVSSSSVTSDSVPGAQSSDEKGDSSTIRQRSGQAPAGMTSSISSAMSSTVVKGTMTDERDGKTYKTVKIGTQTWMAENLNYAYTGVPYSYTHKDNHYTSDSTSWCYDNDPANCAKYGRLYTWSAAMDSVGVWSANGKGCGLGKTCSPTDPVRGICPQGWHVPTKAEFEILINVADGGEYIAGSTLKSTSGWKWDWRFDLDGNGTDDYAFSALPAGFRNNGGQPFGFFLQEGSFADFWSSTEHNSDAYHMYLEYGNYNVYLSYDSDKNYGFSVRCVKD